MENSLWSVLLVASLTQSITQAGWCYLPRSTLFQIFKMQLSFQNILQAESLCREAFQSERLLCSNYIFNTPTKCIYTVYTGIIIINILLLVSALIAPSSGLNLWYTAIVILFD
jgi:hypothetical protein